VFLGGSAFAAYLYVAVPEDVGGYARVGGMGGDQVAQRLAETVPSSPRQVFAQVGQCLPVT
jgi:hypothetical protein